MLLCITKTALDHMLDCNPVSLPPVFLSSTIVEVNIPDKAAAAAPSVVLTAARDDTSPAAVLAMARELPGLKPYHPNQSANVPNQDVNIA